jgi:hypothetical protein
MYNLYEINKQLVVINFKAKNLGSVFWDKKYYFRCSNLNVLAKESVKI